MTQLEVLYRYEMHPAEAALSALGAARQVYGIRRVQIDEAWKTIRVEYDATRMNKDVVVQLLRRCGIDIVEEMPLIPPQPVQEEIAAPATPPAK
jgi:hypothetical protein